MNNILVNWKLISKGIMKGDRVSSDRPPFMTESTKNFWNFLILELK